MIFKISYYQKWERSYLRRGNKKYMLKMISSERLVNVQTIFTSFVMVFALSTSFVSFIHYLYLFIVNIIITTSISISISTFTSTIYTFHFIYLCKQKVGEEMVEAGELIPGQFIGEMSYLSNKKRKEVSTAMVICSSDTYVHSFLNINCRVGWIIIIIMGDNNNDNNDDNWWWWW